jgi:zinc D-Ala-D-Ala carboxypeptidase
MSRAKWFTDQELQGMTDDIVAKLDKARDLFGAPIIMTCGYRDPAHNTEIGGVADSAHTKGMAADVQAPLDPFIRQKLFWSFGAAGFLRIEDAPKHFHVDVDYSKPTPAVWQGTDH